ncbi:type VII secretion system-associated protein [Streptomyces asoensis]|uniref:type VII secretion system-associated protein n=1 Tax=Streptomyces asoensis TaxID=249586 RepID=UPI0033F6462C
MTSPGDEPEPLVAATRASASSTDAEMPVPSEPTDSNSQSDNFPVAQGSPVSVLRGQDGFREPPDDFVAAARLAPDHWLSVIDRHWSGAEGDIPPAWAILGRWRSDQQGEIVEWEVNPDYRPSPDAYGWNAPVSPADAAARIVATGYDREALLAFAMADAEVAVCIDGTSGLALSEAPDGTPAVAVFSLSPGLNEDEVPPHVLMSVADLLNRLPEGTEVLFLSSSAPVAQLVTRAALQAATNVLDTVAKTGGEESNPLAPAKRVAELDDLRRVEESRDPGAAPEPHAGPEEWVMD